MSASIELLANAQGAVSTLPAAFTLPVTRSKVPLFRKLLREYLAAFTSSNVTSAPAFTIKDSLLIQWVKLNSTSGSYLLPVPVA